MLAEKTFSVSKKFQEILGTYNPHKKVFKLNEERAKYWISQHVELSPTVHNLFVSKAIITGEKVRAFNTPKKPVEPAAEAKPAEAAPETKAENSTTPVADAAPTETPVA